MLDAVIEGGEARVADLEEQRVELAARLGENVGRRRAPLQAADGAFFDAYVHPPANKNGVLVRHGRLEGARPPARDAHLVRPADVPLAGRGAGELVEAEREILKKLAGGRGQAGGGP